MLGLCLAFLLLFVKVSSLDFPFKLGAHVFGIGPLLPKQHLKAESSFSQLLSVLCDLFPQILKIPCIDHEFVYHKLLLGIGE